MYFRKSFAYKVESSKLFKGWKYFYLVFYYVPRIKKSYWDLVNGKEVIFKIDSFLTIFFFNLIFRSQSPMKIVSSKY